MIKKIIFIVFITTNFNLMIFSALNSNHWRIIAKDIARDGDPKDRNEFEAARQAFLHIKDESEAKSAALDIQKTWRSSFGILARVGSKTQKGTLMSLTRYPLMDRGQAKKATLELFNNDTIAQFLDEQKLKVVQT